jgi:hypothetical protein
MNEKKGLKEDELEDKGALLFFQSIREENPSLFLCLCGSIGR